MTWLHPTKQWANVPLDPHQTGDFSRVTTTRCVECHATWLGHTPGTPNEYRHDTAIFGVGCERCHGPGKEHVAFHNEHPKGSGTRGIVNPAKLNREQRIDLCAQCHSNTALPAAPAFTHRPGEPIDKSYKTLTSRHPEDDHVANQTKYMRESQCFQHSGMTCLTCHDPHRPTDHKAVAGACLKCHQAADCQEQPGLPAAIRDNCVGCHLPARVWMNVHFHTEKERFVPPIRRYQHRIAVYPEATQEVRLAWEKSRPDGAGRAEVARLSKSLVDHWLGEAEKYRKECRFLSEIMAAREALFFDPSPAVQGRLQAAITRQATIDPTNDAMLYRLGLAYLALEKLPEGRATFERLYRLNPDHAGGCQGLSHVLRRQKEYAEAVRYARRAAQLTESKHADILLSLCDAYADAGRRAEAIETADLALRVADGGLADQIRQRLAKLREAPRSPLGR